MGIAMTKGGRALDHFLKICARTIAFALFAGVLLTAAASDAFADLKLCNMTKSRIGVVIGYRDTKGWVTEGWWNINANNCSDILKGKLNARYYYIHAEDYIRDGEWSGKAFMCVKNKSFTIKNAAKDCVQRGYRKAGFFEVDTTNENDWTIRLTDPGENGK